MQTLIHTAEGKLEAEDPFTVAGQKIQTKNNTENRLAGTSRWHPGIITKRGAEENARFASTGSSKVFVCWVPNRSYSNPEVLQSVLNDRNLGRGIERDRIEAVDEWDRPYQYGI